MRLFLLPISTRQSLIYCQRLNLQLSAETTYADKLSTRAAATWLKWEKSEKSTFDWQKRVTRLGNQLFQRLPYAEWGLKSIPPLSARKRREEIEGKEEVRVEYPDAFIEPAHIQRTLEHLGSSEKQAFHQKWFLASMAGMPISAPVALLPVIPNLPFFYLVFRAWSHWRARSGSKHLEFLLRNNLIKFSPSVALGAAYAEASIDTSLKQLEAGMTVPGSEASKEAGANETQERMLLSKSSGKDIAKYLEVPEVEVEIERAIWQIKRSINSNEESNKATNGAGKIDEAGEKSGAQR